MEYRYNYLNNFLKNKFDERTLKICIDGGFTCPNRDGKLSTRGCIFCSEMGSGERLYGELGITKQVLDTIKYKEDRANKFIVYFQNFTNTYDSVDNLKKKYDAALVDDRIVALAIATRPDCIDEDVVKLIKSYSEKYYVWVELGLQTIDNRIGNVINRCYTTEQYEAALKILNDNGIDVVTHFMIGLPGETKEILEDEIKFINKHSIQGIKIHSTYIVKNTALEKMYVNGEYEPITFEYYMDTLIHLITHLKKDIVIHRFSGDAPRDTLVAPEWTGHKKKVMNELNNRMERENLYQGCKLENVD